VHKDSSDTDPSAQAATAAGGGRPSSCKREGPRASGKGGRELGFRQYAPKLTGHLREGAVTWTEAHTPTDRHHYPNLNLTPPSVSKATRNQDNHRRQKQASHRQSIHLSRANERIYPPGDTRARDTKPLLRTIPLDSHSFLHDMTPVKGHSHLSRHVTIRAQPPTTERPRGG